MPRRPAFALVAALALAIAALASASARAATRLELIVFPGGYNWPVWAAEESGAFARAGLDVHVTETPNSVFLMTGLIEGRYDLAITAFDNIVAYDEGQGPAKPTVKPQIFAAMGVDNAFLHLVSAPAIHGVGELRGKTLSVDAKTTGYAFVLYKLLQKAGLTPADYTIVAAGGTQQRYEALLRGEHAATLLATPFDLQARAQGFDDLGAAVDAIGDYQGLSLAVQRPWALAHRQSLEVFIRAYVEGLRWLRDPANHDAATALLRRRVAGMSAEVAEASYKVLLAPVRGFAVDARLDPAGIATVLALRNEFGGGPTPLTDPAKYYDLAYYREALGR